MAGYDGKGTIPRRGKVREYVARVSGPGEFGKFLLQGLIFSFLSCFPTVLGVLLRGCFYRLVVGRMGSGCFLEKNIRFFRPARFFLGNRVFIGESCFFDVGGRGEKIEVGDDSHLARLVTARTQFGRISIGTRVNVGAGSFLYAYGDIIVGDDCLIANGVELISGDHSSSDPARPMRLQGREPSRIEIGADCWLGTRSVILGGVHIGRGCIVGAGAVVTGDLPPYSVAAGVPARVLRRRDQLPAAADGTEEES